MRAGGCPAVMAQWQSTGGSSQRCPRFDSRRLPTFFTFFYFHLITSKFIYYGVSMLQIMSDDELPSFCSGVGLVGEKVPLLLSMASSMLTSEYSSPPSSDPFRVAIGGGLEGFWWNERDKLVT